jgi:hypothetical protein
MPLTAESKSLAFTELRARIYSAGVELYPHQQLLSELRQLRKQFKANRSSVETPRTSRGHSDIAVALAIATWLHDRSGIPAPRSTEPKPNRETEPAIVNESELGKAFGTPTDRTRRRKWFDRSSSIRDLSF